MQNPTSEAIAAKFIILRPLLDEHAAPRVGSGRSPRPGTRRHEPRREWSPQGQPEEVEVHDFPSKTLGKVIPYGVYDEATNTGWVSVGVDHDTAEFAVETVRRWWRQMGSQTYPKAKRLLITADGGGSNGSRCRLWKVELQRLARRACISVPLSTGDEKWNKIEHRVLPHTENWRGRPLVMRSS